MKGMFPGNKRKSRALLMLCAMACAALYPMTAGATDKATPAYYETRMVTRGVMISEVESNVRKGPGTDYDRITSMDTGETCEVLGEDNGWYHIVYKGREGYILKDFLSVSTAEEEVEKIIEQPLSSSISGLVTPRVMQRRATFSLEGVVQSNLPLVGVSVSVVNLRTLEEETSASATFSREEQVYEYDLLRLDEDLKFRRLSAGEKRLTITVQSANERQTVAQEDFYVLGECVEPVSMTESCDFSDRAVTDGKYRTAWTPSGAGDALTISIPEGRTAQRLTLEWTSVPGAFTVEMRDGAENILGTVEESGGSGMVAFSYETGAARKIVVRAGESGAGICEARVYEQGKTPEAVQNWQQLGDKVDMMMIAAHQGDELLFFGGALPYAVSEGRQVAVVYMADCGRQRYAEALDGLWAVGVRQHPICMGLPNKAVRAYEDAIDLWGLEETYEKLVTLIRQYKPEVIVTHDIEGEDGDNQHKLTSATVRRAVLLAADPEMYPESYELYGAWDVKKTYIHRYEGNVLTLDMDSRLNNLNGWTAQELLSIAYSKHRTLMDDFSLAEGAEYDHRSFGLIRTTVGDDVQKNSFFENVD